MNCTKFKMQSLLVLLILVFAGCQQSGIEKYKALKEKELASGRHIDSLFLGLKLGMSSKDFYARCWELNKAGLITDGENNTAVQYKIEKELKHPAVMNFYPSFVHNKIAKMKVTFHYMAWAPWNKHLYADSLQSEVVKLYQQWYRYGNPFIPITHENRGTLYVKVDGNRRITIGRFDDMKVKVEYTDLLLEN